MNALHATTQQPVNAAMLGETFHVTPIVYRRADGSPFRFEYWLKSQGSQATIRARGEQHHEAGLYDLVSCASSGELVLEQTGSQQRFVRQCMACGSRFSSNVPFGEEESEVRRWIAAALAGRDSHQPARELVEPFGDVYVCPGECQ